jgi:hypothetical protein
LDPPKCKPEVREQYLQEMKLLIEDQLYDAKSDAGITEGVQ